MKSFEGSFRNLSFSLSTSILLNFFFPFIDIRCLFSSLKLQYCRTIALLKLMLFFKSDDLHAISRQEKHRLPKRTAQFPAKNPASGFLEAPLPFPQSLYGRTDLRAYADVTTKFLGSIGYQICLPMVLRELR